VTPFRQLVDLLYSEKKPGEVPPKQLIVDLVFSLFDLYRQPGIGISPVLKQGSPSSSSRSAMQPALAPITGSGTPDGCQHISEFILSLLREPPKAGEKTDQVVTNDNANRKSRIIAPASELPAPKLEMHDFIAAAHKPRIFQTYLKELSQTCWDFFWYVPRSIGIGARTNPEPIAYQDNALQQEWNMAVQRCGC
jgi:hypothetical protein